jgi:hypothetical protein
LLTFSSFKLKRYSMIAEMIRTWVSITWCYERVTIYVMNFPLVDCYVAFWLYWQLMESKCKLDGSWNCEIWYELSLSFLCMLDQVFNCIAHWYMLHLLTSIVQIILARKYIVSTVKVFFRHYLSRSSLRIKTMIYKCHWQDTCGLRASGAC